jgi:hypothetical protein
LASALVILVSGLTWVVLIDTPARRVRELEELLAVKGLVHILVFSFFNAPIGLLPLAGSGGGR